jgi:hypothetical protein
MSGFEINTDSLRQAGGGLQQVCGKLGEQLDKVKQELLSMGKPWGDDDIGQLIEVAYEEVVDFAFECLKDVLDELCASGQDLINQATQWDEKEQSILSDFDQFFSQLGSR